MPGFFRSKKTPDSVLNKCRDMIELGEDADKIDAWTAISEFLPTCKRRGWRDAHEDLMLLFVDLSVELRKNPKDGFIQYRMICQTNRLDSLKTCLQALVEKAEERGQAEYRELKDKYDGKEGPEDLKQFTEEQYNKPYLKYQWSVYRAVLDVLRNNQKLDALYQDTVRRGIEFCLALKRTTEFRKLCEVCRKHLTAIFGHQTQPNRVEIHTAQMLGIYLNTRFELLENATKLSMWQQAFHLITDIHQLKEKSKTQLDPALETNYYKKLSQIFLESDNMLLHAYSILRYYSLSRDAYEHDDGEQKKKKRDEGIYARKLTKEELDQLGKRCVLACLASEIPRTRSQVMGPPMSSKEEKNKKMAEKLNFFLRPNRGHLMKQLYHEDLLDIHDDFNTLKELMIEDFSPLTLCSKVKACINRIKDHNPDLTKPECKFQRYEAALERAAVRKLINSVSKMYSSIEMHRLEKMFFSESCIYKEGWTPRRIESLIIKMVEENFIWCRMSHSDSMLYFRAPDRLERNSFMQTYLSNLAHRLNDLYDQELSQERVNRQNFYDSIRAELGSDQGKILRRAQTIARLRTRAEFKGRLVKHIGRVKTLKKKHEGKSKVRQETERLQKIKIQQNEENQQSMADRIQSRNAYQKAAKQLKIVQKGVDQDILKKAKKMNVTDSSMDAFQLLNNANVSDELLDAKAIDAVTVDLFTSIREAQNALKQEELQTMDYHVRACRREEIPLLKKQYKAHASTNSKKNTKEYEERVAQLEKDHIKAVEMKKVFLLATKSSEFFNDNVTKRRTEQFEKHLEMWASEKKKWEEERKRSRQQQAQKRRDLQLENQKRLDRERKRHPQQTPVFNAPEPQEKAPPASNAGTGAGAEGGREPPMQQPRVPQPMPAAGLRKEAPEREPIRRPERRTPQPDRDREFRGQDVRQDVDRPPPQTNSRSDEADNWRRPAAAPQSRGRPRFINSKKAKEPEPAPAQAGAPSGPTAGSVRPADGSVRRSARGPTRPAGNTRPAAGSVRSVRPSAGSIRPVPRSVRPTGPVRPQPLKTGSVRPSAGAYRPPRTGGNYNPDTGGSSIRPTGSGPMRRSQGGRFSNSSPRDRDNQNQAGSWRERSRLRNEGHLNVSSPGTNRFRRDDNTHNSKSEGRRKFFNNSSGSERDN